MRPRDYGTTDYETRQARNGALLTGSAAGGSLLAMPWQPLTLLTNLSGRVDFTDVDATSFNERFHRIQAVLQRAAGALRRQDPL